MLTLQNGLVFCLILVSFFITYQDFKERLVSLWLLILFASVSLASLILNRDWNTVLYNTIDIVLYLGLILAVLKLYLYLKFKKNKKIINELLGIADIVIIFFIGITFNIIGIIFFFCFGFIFTVLGYFILSLLQKKSKHQTIPLAGFLVIFYMLSIFILYLVKANNYIDCSFVN